MPYLVLEDSNLHPEYSLAPKLISYGLFIVANEPDLEYLIDIIKKVPVLESTRGTTLESFYGRKAAD